MCLENHLVCEQLIEHGMLRLVTEMASGSVLLVGPSSCFTE